MIKLLFVFALIMPNLAFGKVYCAKTSVDVSFDNDSLATGAASQVADMSELECIGVKSEAFRITSISMHPDLVDAGFEGYAQTGCSATRRLDSKA